MKHILIAGGTGFIGKALTQHLQDAGYRVSILTRKPVAANHIYWNPGKGEIDTTLLSEVSVLINLCGEGIADQRWTVKRKQQLYASRIETTRFLAQHSADFHKLETYISASGITCYGLTDTTKIFNEEDTFGQDYISELVKEWENAADLFKATTRVVKLRIAVVLSWLGGALPKMAKPIQFGLGSPIGTGNQPINWIHLTDLCRLFQFAIEQPIEGAFNTNAGNHTNRELTTAIAKSVSKKIVLPYVPAFLLRLVLGEMSDILLKGVHVSNAKLKNAGFNFQIESIEEAVAR